MDLFTYLMAKNGHNTSIHEDLFSYLLGKSQGGGGEIKTATGITINIPDAKKLVSFMMTKESTQDGEPTPDNPVEVKTVKGYRNLFDKNSVTATSLNADGTTSNSATLSTTDFIEIDSLKTYYKTITGSSRVKLYDVNKNVISTSSIADISDFSNARSFTIPYSNAKYIRITLTNENVNSFQLVEGTEELPYVPYGNNYILYKQVGKNLLNYNSNYLKRNTTVSVNVNNNQISLSNSNSTGNTGIAYFVPVEIGESITISYSNISVASSNNRIQYEFYDEPLTELTSVALGTTIDITNKYVTTNATKAYLMVLIRVDNGSSYVLSDLMVSYSNDKVYELYKETTTTIPLNNNEIVGIGNYKDELLVDKSGHVFINKKTGKVVLNGSETITYNSGSTWKFRYTIQDANFTNASNEKASLLSNYFQVGIWNSSQNNQMATLSSSPKLVGIRFDDMNSLADFKAWLSTHNTEIYYPLETPELIDLQTTVDLSLFKGVNNVSNSEDGYMTIEYQ